MPEATTARRNYQLSVPYVSYKQYTPTKSTRPRPMCLGDVRGLSGLSGPAPAPPRDAGDLVDSLVVRWMHVTAAGVNRSAGVTVLGAVPMAKFYPLGKWYDT